MCVCVCVSEQACVCVFVSLCAGHYMCVHVPGISCNLVGAFYSNNILCFIECA